MNVIPRPLDGEIHLYCLTLPQDSAEQSRLGRHLSTSETDRAGLLKSDRAKMRYIAGRGVLREIIGGYLGSEPADVRFASGEHGKPLLENCEENLRFNLSHADELLILAVAAGIEVGVDIERVDADKPLHDMARLAFSRTEQEEMFSLPPPAFYRCWVRKEACMKACGRGFSLRSDSFHVSPLLDETAALNVSCNHTFWQILDIDMPHHYCAALAVEARPSDSPPRTTHITVMQHPFRR